jgi:hypothetical protein
MRALKISTVNLFKIVRFAVKVIADNRLDNAEDNFVKRNRKIWKGALPAKQDGEILIEVNSMSSSIIAFSYLANLLARIHKAVIKGYVFGDYNTRTKILNRKIKRIYKSFNTQKFLYRQPSNSQQDEIKDLYQDILLNLKTKKDVEDLKLEGLWIGDLLYDSHCMRYMVPTVELDDDRFRSSLKDAVESYIYWRDYFKEHDIKSVLVTHTVYVHSGVITRLAINKGIPVYQVSATHVYFLNHKNLWAYDDFFYYPERFRELSQEEQKNGLEIAKQRINLRFSGEVGVDMHYSTKSAYGNKHSKRVLKESERTKVLVATHCFFDSPHPYGVNLFPDFYEWLYFLGAVSERTDYDWYIKTHPDFLPGNVPIIEEFIKKYPKFSLIPSSTSHLQLIEEGINYGLTVYGTIGFEYAALGVPVINASLCNPHIRYSFNIHPRTIDEYERILMDLPNQKLEIDISEVYEYYFMAFIYDNTNNWLFLDYEGFVKSMSNYADQFGSISYEVFFEEFTIQRHEETLRSLKRFVDSKEYRFRTSSNG